jgi:hypothetical protein
MDKRKLDEDEVPQKKFINEKDQQLYSTSDEWPIYYHPQGGYIKITPWGSLRITTNDNGEIIQKFQDCSFDELEWNFPEPQPQQQFQQQPHSQPQLPSTPQSINITLSPDTDAENYVIDGFKNAHSQFGAHPNNDIPTFTEHENYFGMNDDIEM